MNLFKSPASAIPLVDVDALLQDSYLLVVALGQGSTTLQGDRLWDVCAGQVERVRTALNDSGMNQRSIDHIVHAQCALLDESVFTLADKAVREQWQGEPLQARFFNRHQAGEFLYEEIREVLGEPAPNPSVLTVYQRVMLLGFRGRYQDLHDPQRLQLIEQLDARVAPLHLDQAAIGRLVVGRSRNPVHWLASPLVHGVAAAALLAAIWLGLDQHLAELIASLAIVQS